MKLASLVVFLFLTPSSVALAQTVCSNSTDDDGDGISDYPGDAGCDTPYDTDESGDVLVVVYGNVSDTNLSTCVDGSDATNCNNIGGAGARVTICSGSSSAACSGVATKWTVSGNINVTQSHISVNRLTTEFNLDESDDYFAFVDSFSQGGYFADGADFVAIYNSNLDGDANNTGCADSNQNISACWNDPDAPDVGTCNDGELKGWRIVGNLYEDFYSTASGFPGDHSEAIYMAGGSNGAFISGNTFNYNATTSHIFLTYYNGIGDGGTGNPPGLVGGRGICVSGNTYGPRGTKYPGTGCDDGTAFSDAAFSTGNSPQGFASTMNSRIDEPGDDTVDCDLGGTCLGACMQCNNGIDDDSDGKADFWGGAGDGDCTSYEDNSEQGPASAQTMQGGMLSGGKLQ